jgi:hypothetical protein
MKLVRSGNSRKEELSAGSLRKKSGEEVKGRTTR